MNCKKCLNRANCISPFKDTNHPDVKCTAQNAVRLPALPGDDVYWIDEMCEGAPKIICDKGAVEAVCYYGNGVFKIKCKNDEPEDIGTKWCCLTYEQAEKVLEDLKK